MRSNQVPRLVVALVEPEQQSEEELYPEENDSSSNKEGFGRPISEGDVLDAYRDMQVVEPEPTPPRLVEKRSLTPPKKVSLTPFSQPKTAPSKLTRFGVILESLDERILTSVTRDILALVASLPPGERLVVCPATSGDIWERLAEQMPIDIQYGGFEKTLWKTYWINKKPQPPKGIRPTLEERVASTERKPLKLRPGTDVPMPTNRDDGWVLPAQDNPNFRRVPTMAPVQMTPQLYLWSSRAPVSGEKVVFPETEEVMTIVSISGSVAKVGPNHVSLDMSGYEYFQPLNVWASRSFKKDQDEK